MSKKSDLIVMKFGGSCLQDSESFAQTTNNIKKYHGDSTVVVVCSAVKGVTDELINYYKRACVKGDSKECRDQINTLYSMHMSVVDNIINNKKPEHNKAQEFIKKNVEELTQLGRVIGLIRPSADIQDLIVSYGEKLSTFIVSQYFNSIDLKADFISSSDIIVTDDNFGNALPLLDETEKKVEKKLLPLLKQDESLILCITGYYGSTTDKKITTLGRGGTDLTAAIMAYCFMPHYSSKVIYWKDVKGFLNADPRISKKTSLLKHLSYIEAKELAFFGSKVLHPVCLDVNEKRNIPSEIRLFKEPDTEEFTLITNEIIEDEEIIKAITSIQKLSMVTVESGTMVSLPGTASSLFALFGENNINIKFISQSSSENNITIGIDYDHSMKVSKMLRNSKLFGKQWFRIKIDNDISLIAVIGAGMLHTPGIAGKIFTTLGNNKVNVRAIAQGSSELNITMIVERDDCKRAINVLYDAFIS